MSSAEGHLRQKLDQMDSISKMSASLTWKVTQTAAMQTNGEEMRRDLWGRRREGGGERERGREREGGEKEREGEKEKEREGRRRQAMCMSSQNVYLCQVKNGSAIL